MKKIMQEQWDNIAHKNAFYGVLSTDEFENINQVDVDRFWETGHNDVDSILKVIGLESTRQLSMLEIGCGLGRMTHYFAKIFRKVSALDVSAEMLKRAEGYWKHLKNVDWLLGNGKDLHQIPDESMDFVFCFRVLQHVPNRAVVLNYICEAERVLKKGGIAYLQFRVLPSGMGLVSLKYFISTHWPSPVEKFLRRLWDLINGYQGIRADFAREYECWRGCALRPTEIEKVASETRLQIQHTGSRGTQSSGTLSGYYVFRKLGRS